jgi:DNA-binding transcriptional MerR regulator
MTDAKGIAQLTGISVHTWRYWRKAGVGPPAYKINGRVLYDPTEVDTWMREHRESGALVGADRHAQPA